MKFFQNFFQQPRELSPKERIWLTEVRQFISLNFHKSDYSIKKLAHQTRMSESKLLYKMKKLTGFTPKKYINEFRLTSAEQLLKSKSYSSVAEVCFAVGFQKPAYFSKLFKKRFKKLPSDYFKS